MEENKNQSIGNTTTFVMSPPTTEEDTVYKELLKKAENLGRKNQLIKLQEWFELHQDDTDAVFKDAFYSYLRDLANKELAS